MEWCILSNKQINKDFIDLEILKKNTELLKRLEEKERRKERRRLRKIKKKKKKVSFYKRL